MSFLPSNGASATSIPVTVRSAAAASTWGSGWSQSMVFPIEAGTKGVSVRLNHNASTTESYFLRMMYSIEVEPNVPGGFDFIRKDIYVIGPPIYYSQDVYQIGFINVASISGGTLNANFDLNGAAAKWAILEVACTNNTSSPNISLEICYNK